MKYKAIFTKYKLLLLVWLLILVFMGLGIIFKWDKFFVTVLIILFGFITKAFTGLITLLSFIPVIGPILTHILTLPIFILLNGLAYLLTFFAIKGGQKKEAINAKILTTIFLIGIIIGIIVGKII